MLMSFCVMFDIIVPGSCLDLRDAKPHRARIEFQDYALDERRRVELQNIFERRKSTPRLKHHTGAGKCT